ncbi:MAG TPA: hypothetical protein VK760_05125, partial [Candidatus Acidoferrales bacterium]|nr:hypothetical protein [Candidatus Acidoferrales bacterium]
VPRSAVATTENGDIVYLVVDGKAVATPVKVGVQTDTLSQVISPKVTPGAVVITTRPDALKDGSPVQASGATPPPAPGEKGPKPSTSPSAAPSGQ